MLREAALGSVPWQLLRARLYGCTLIKWLYLSEARQCMPNNSWLRRGLNHQSKELGAPLRGQEAKDASIDHLEGDHHTLHPAKEQTIL